MIEISITIKDESTTITQKHLVYNPTLLSRASPDIQPLVDQVMENFKGNADDADVIIKAKMIW